MADDVRDRPDVDALYALDPSEFVAARNALVKELKASGEKDVAAEVGRLKKPSKLAWAVNSVARAEPDLIEELREAGAELRDRQDEALAGGDADALRAATVSRRDVVRRLTRLVVELAGEAHREEAAATFEAASVDAEHGAELVAGRLTSALERPSDLGFLGLLGAAGEGAPPRRRAPAPARRGKAPAPAEPVRIDTKRIQKLERALASAEDARADAEHAVERAEREQEEAAEALAAAQERVEAAERQLDEATDARHAAERAVAAARAELDAVQGN
ncbi:hypothetical protein [Actinomarinicola tropica]|uniref:Uncharacterized protein n=1 Tax=Actinomarinicola tropica TaxID=2789776 RepID=A0A5Q2RMZ4_9ACTN|nr:hypothetical protein [Actinomarinicola tropica]QGG95776.1 hypothetical protein GH723_12085 [Actinomarinicola tropica]